MKSARLSRRSRRGSPPGSALPVRPRLEVLEDRTLPSLFLAAKSFATATHPNSVAVADLNGDGRVDLVVANDSSNTVSVLLGNGNGTFQSAVNYSVGSFPAGVA